MCEAMPHSRQISSLERRAGAWPSTVHASDVQVGLFAGFGGCRVSCISLIKLAVFRPDAILVVAGNSITMPSSRSCAGKRTARK